MGLIYALLGLAIIVAANTVLKRACKGQEIKLFPLFVLFGVSASVLAISLFALSVR